MIKQFYMVKHGFLSPSIFSSRRAAADHAFTMTLGHKVVASWILMLNEQGQFRCPVHGVEATADRIGETDMFEATCGCDSLHFR